MHQTSTLAQAAILLFVPLAVFLFQNVDRVRATAFSLVGGTLFLPERVEFDLPLIPPLDKHSISCLMVFIMLKVGRKDEVPGPGSKFIPVMIAIAAMGAVGTMMTNRDTLVLSEVVVKQGLTFRDLISMLSQSLLFMVLRATTSRPARWASTARINATRFASTPAAVRRPIPADGGATRA
jgi:hypothetical protein